MPTTRTTHPMVVGAITIVAATTGLFGPATAGAATPVEVSAAHTFCSDVNAERAARGLTVLRCTYDGNAQSAADSHTDATAVWIAYVTNPATATIAFMGSADHRWWLMDPTATTIDIGVSCVTYNDPDGWTRSLMDVGANLPDARGPDGAPPAGAITRPDPSTPCGPAEPPRNQALPAAAVPPVGPETPPTAASTGNQARPDGDSSPSTLPRSLGGSRTSMTAPPAKNPTGQPTARASADHDSMAARQTDVRAPRPIGHVSSTKRVEERNPEQRAAPFDLLGAPFDVLGVLFVVGAMAVAIRRARRARRDTPDES